MKTIGCTLACSSLGLVAVALFGCAGDTRHDESAPPPPPPPPAETRPAPTIYYPHGVHGATDVALRRKLVIALARWANDRDVEDAPFGDDEREQPKVAVGVQVDVQVGDRVDGRLLVQSAGLSPHWRRILRRELLDSGAFVVVERDGILGILREIKFGESRYVNPASSPEVGEVIAVQYLLEGSIGWTQDPTFKGSVEPLPRYDERSQSLAQAILALDRGGVRSRLEELKRLRLRQVHVYVLAYEYPYSAYLSLYSVRTGEVVAEAFGIGATPLDALREAVDDLADACAEIAPPPRIAWVDGDRVFIEVGSDDGVLVGERFRYTWEGPAIRSAAGLVIGHDTQEGGLLEITRTEPLMSLARVIERVREPTVGDRVERDKQAEGTPVSGEH